MYVTEVTLATPAGRKYLVQLCKHFRHKVAAEWAEDGSTGSAALPTGACALQADEAGLFMRCEARDEAGVAVAQKIIEEHLAKFAFRETLAYDWKTFEAR